MVYIYVLRLAEGKRYVGKTSNPNFRLDDHFNGHGSAWTRKYEPISYRLFPDCDDFDEDKYTLKYMKKYGKDNVRGGSFCQMTLDKGSIKTIERMIRGGDDTCYNCGEEGHFANRCFYKNVEKGICKHTTKTTRGKKQKSCHRCGREGHDIDSCYANWYENGMKIPESDEDTSEDGE